MAGWSLDLLIIAQFLYNCFIEGRKAALELRLWVKGMCYRWKMRRAIKNQEKYA